MKNNAAYMTGLSQMELREIPMPVPSQDEVLIQLEYVGICGSDVHYYQHGRIGNFVVDGDFILGHECAGVICQLGEQVTGLQVGQRVTLEPGATCGQCAFCKSGNYNLCPDVKFLATPPYHGCFANYITFPASLVYPLPETLSTRDAALIEPLAVGMEATDQGSVSLGSSVVILGAGCIGLTTLLAAKARGATDITVVDVLENRLEKAMELGATRTFNGKDAQVCQNILAALDQQGADVVFETAGSRITTQMTPYLIKRGGTIVLVGMAPEACYDFDFAQLMGQVGQIKTIFRYKNQYPAAIEAVAAGNIKLDAIISSEYAFQDVKQAFDDNIQHKNDIVKTVVHF